MRSKSFDSNYMYTSNKGQDDFRIVFRSTNGHPVFKKLKKVFYVYFKLYSTGKKQKLIKTQ